MMWEEVGWLPASQMPSRRRPPSSPGSGSGSGFVSASGSGSSSGAPSCVVPRCPPVVPRRPPSTTTTSTSTTLLQHYINMIHIGFISNACSFITSISIIEVIRFHNIIKIHGRPRSPAQSRVPAHWGAGRPGWTLARIHCVYAFFASLDRSDRPSSGARERRTEGGERGRACQR